MPPSVTCVELSATHRGELAARQWLRENPCIYQCKCVPLPRTLRLEIPPDPPIVLLKRIQLRLNVGPHVVPELGIPGRDIALPGTAANIAASGKAPVVSSTNAIAVEILGAISHRASPFTDNDPFIGAASPVGSVVADHLAMFPRLHCHEFRGEDLIFVMIDENILCVVVRCAENAVPGACGYEAIVQDDRSIRCVTGLVVAVAVELLERVKVEIRAQRFIQELDGDDDVLILWLSIFCGDGFEDLKRSGNSIALLPTWASHLVAGVIEAILLRDISEGIQSMLGHGKLHCPGHHEDQSKS